MFISKTVLNYVSYFIKTKTKIWPYCKLLKFVCSIGTYCCSYEILFLLIWFTACEKNVSLPSLPPTTVCVFTESCSGFDCCTFVELLNRTVHTVFRIDPCAEMLTLGIESVTRNITLSEYQWGNFKWFITALSVWP